MEGFDWVVLESFAAYALKKCTEFGHEAELIPVPLRKLKTTTLKDEDSKQDPSIILNKYNRTMQLQNVPAYEVPFICQVLARHIPEGVEFTVREPDPADDAYFYIPDTELEQLKAEVAAEHEEKKARKLAKIAEKQNE
ncbi:uncharacterized protein LOC106153765 [Lingula anatina]|nr:uncharacterized protein LOC106153765 [Lingula anatina]|eukprot:XP_013383318.1 uncharacterized protein LOC106153765 [Lingula anatina]